MDPDDDWLNPGHKSLQCGRRNDALKLWAQWQALGDIGYSERVERQYALSRAAADIVRASPRMRLAVEPEWVAVCFVVEGKSSEAICTALYESGAIKVGYGRVNGEVTIRLVTVDPSATQKDLENFFDAVLAAAETV